MLHEAGRRYAQKIKDATLIEELAILNGEEPSIDKIIGMIVIETPAAAESTLGCEEYNPTDEDSMKLAAEIHNIEHADFRTIRQWNAENKTKWSIGEGVTLERSIDHMMWYLWAPVPYKGNRYWFKAVPKLHLNKREIKKILDAQGWQYI